MRFPTATDLVPAAALSPNQVSFGSWTPSLSQFVDGDDDAKFHPKGGGLWIVVLSRVMRQEERGIRVR